VANPTTNYGFVLPTATDLVTDLPADFDVALQGVDTRLKALNPETTLGDIAYASATANTNTRLGIGSTGNVLTVAGGVPTWAAPAGGGKIAQVKAFEGTNTLALTTSYATLDSLSITPTSATSKIYASITVLAKPRNSSGAGSTTVDFQLHRGATLVSATSTVATSFMQITQNEGGPIITTSIVCLDSPATTSATTYNVKAKADNTTQTSYAQRCYITLWEVLA
jgi:hypothetical protein